MPRPTEIQKRIRERDHFTCHDCGGQQGEINKLGRHQRPFRLTTWPAPAVGDNPDDYITLCTRCYRLRMQRILWAQSGDE